MVINKRLIAIYDKLPNKIKRIIWTIFDTIKCKKWKKIHTTPDGIKFDLDLGELIDNSIYNFWFFERDTHNAIEKIVKKDMYCLDIWANVWAHTLTMAKIAGKNWKVIAFEPMKWAFAKLSRNCSLNSFKNIELNNIWLSDNNCEIEWKFITSWRIDGTKPTMEKQIIELRTLDDFVKEKNNFININIKVILFLKIF